jgi:cytochrome c-type biogenesis protein CcmH
MLVWLVLAAMTALAVLAIVYPLGRAAAGAEADSGDKAFYRTQLAEIDRDTARGLMSPAEAEAARAEAARRLLRAAGAEAAAAPAAAALRRRRMATIAAVIGVPLLALPLYGRVGKPGLPERPLAERLEAAKILPKLPLDEAVRRAEATLAADPGNGLVAEFLAPQLMKAKKFDAALRAHEIALSTLGETPKRLTDFAVALMASAATNNRVSTAAPRFLKRALELDGNFHLARFYLGVALAETGDTAAAREALQTLSAALPAEAPIQPQIKRMLGQLGGGAVPEGGEAIAALPQNEREQAIRGMVESLDQRLAASGGSVDEWLRLVRSYSVLKEAEKAKAAVARARKAFADKAADLDAFDKAVAALGLQGDPR